MKILIAYDGSSAADAALREVRVRPWPARTQVRVVSVVDWPVTLELPFPPDPRADIADVRAVLTERAKKSLAKAEETLSSRADLDVTSEVREGSPKSSLLDAIEAWKPDLVMAGSTGKSGLKKLLVGSVCHALVTHAPCSVEVVKTPVRMD
jgi:nucleotide-binding universal stress UspA family protein